MSKTIDAGAMLLLSFSELFTLFVLGCDGNDAGSVVAGMGAIAVIGLVVWYVSPSTRGSLFVLVASPPSPRA